MYVSLLLAYLCFLVNNVDKGDLLQDPFASKVYSILKSTETVAIGDERSPHVRTSCRGPVSSR